MTLDIDKFVEIIFHTSNWKLKKPLPRGKNEKLIGLMKDELDRKIMRKLVPLWSERDFLTRDDSINSKAKDTKKGIIK